MRWWGIEIDTRRRWWRHLRMCWDPSWAIWGRRVPPVSVGSQIVVVPLCGAGRRRWCVHRIVPCYGCISKIGRLLWWWSGAIGSVGPFHFSYICRQRGIARASWRRCLCEHFGCTYARLCCFCLATRIGQGWSVPDFVCGPGRIMTVLYIPCTCVGILLVTILVYTLEKSSLYPTYGM